MKGLWIYLAVYLLCLLLVLALVKFWFEIVERLTQ